MFSITSCLLTISAFAGIFAVVASPEKLHFLCHAPRKNRQLLVLTIWLACRRWTLFVSGCWRGRAQSTFLSVCASTAWQKTLEVQALAATTCLSWWSCSSVLPNLASCMLRAWQPTQMQPTFTQLAKPSNQRPLRVQSP